MIGDGEAIIGGGREAPATTGAGDASPGRVLFLGLGYVASYLARRLHKAGWGIVGTARERSAIATLQARGWEAYHFDGGAALPAEAWQGVTHVLSSIPPTAEGDPALASLEADLIARAGQLRWVGYLSTVGVYGDHGGGWVDETTPPRPVTARGARRLAAERAWMALWRGHGLPVHVFRLPGIYGPGRSPLDKARQGARKALVVKEGQVFSRIHVEDLVEALALSMARPTAGEIYNVTDDLPAAPHEVALFAHELLGLAPPPLVPFEEAELSPMARSFYAESKRVSNRKIKARLGWHPKYPDYRGGLRAILARDGNDGGP